MDQFGDLTIQGIRESCPWFDAIERVGRGFGPDRDETMLGRFREIEGDLESSRGVYKRYLGCSEVSQE